MPQALQPGLTLMPNPDLGAASTPPIVAIGASAGGLDALERLFDSLNCDTGATFVVIQHLSPDHKSMMANLLSRHTQMPVVMVEQDMPITRPGLPHPAGFDHASGRRTSASDARETHAR